MIRVAARRATRILTVSEASKRDILHYTGVRRREGRRGLQRHRRALHGGARRGRDRPGAPALRSVASVRALRRQHQAAQEPRAADRGVRAGPRRRARRPQAGGHRRRDLQVSRRCGSRCTATASTSTCGSSASSRRPRWWRSTGWPARSSSRRSTRASACRRSRPWPTGTPVVTSNVSSLPEVVGDAAVLVDPYDSRSIADGIRRVVTDEPLRQELIARGRRRVQAFSWHEAATRTLQVYRDVGETRVVRHGLADARRAGARLAHRHARGREGARADLPRSFPAPTSSRWCTCRAACRRRSRPTRFTPPFIQRLPFVARAYRHYLPLFPAAIERFDLRGFDLVVSCSHCVAKSVIVPPGARHLCYCLTPMRYAWDQFDAYFGPERVGALASAALKPVMARLARWDRATADRPNRYLAISQYVARRIALYYNRESTIVYPPVDTEAFTPGDAGSRHALLDRVGLGALQTPGTGHRSRSRRPTAARHHRRRS